MGFIKEYSSYVKNSPSNSLNLPKGIVLSNTERMDINRNINRILVGFYNIDRFSKDPIMANGKPLLPEYLFKAVNNRTLLKKIVYDDRNEIPSNVNTKEDLFNFIQNNSFDLFHYDGKYFKYVYNLLVSTSVKGKNFENKAFAKFEETAKKRGLDISVQEPSSVQEDIGGVDGAFYHRGKRFTIQVKPLFKIEDYKIENNKYIAFCDGVLKDLKTDYLILTNKNETWIFRAKGVEVYKSYFTIPKENLVD